MMNMIDYYIDLKLPQTKLRDITIYLPTGYNQKEQNIKLQTKGIHILKESLEQNFKVIVMGDFNCDLDKYYNVMDRQLKVTYQYRLVHYLHSHGFFDSHRKSESKPGFTWQRPNHTSCSRIDGIFFSSDLINQFIYTGSRLPH